MEYSSELYYDKVLNSNYGRIFYMLNIFHIISIPILIIYPFIFNNYFTDMIYIYVLFMLLFLWLLLKNECLIFILEKKLIDKNYIVGTNNIGPGFDYILRDRGITIYGINDKPKGLFRKFGLVFLTFIFCAYVIYRRINTSMDKTTYLGFLLLLVYFNILYNI